MLGANTMVLGKLKLFLLVFIINSEFITAQDYSFVDGAFELFRKFGGAFFSGRDWESNNGRDWEYSNGRYWGSNSGRDWETGDRDTRLGVSRSYVNPEELGNYFEGDIIFPSNGISSRNGIIGPSSRWPQGIIPYVIDPVFSSSDRRTIEWAIEQYGRLTCIKFIPRLQETDYVHITGDQGGCFSSVGRVGGRQQVNLQIPACVQRGTVVHELMHAVGFFHEHSRIDRDKYISIAYNNILPGREINFEKRTSDSFNVPYDYRSIMHYSENAFSRNGRPTLVAKTPGVTIGQRVHFSKKDLRKIQRMYRCKRGRSYFF